VFGYDVESDLARHYDWAATLLLTLTGELPTDEQARAATAAMVFWAPAPITEAPAHAVSVARLCGATNSSMLGIGAITLAEQVSAMLVAHRDTRAWLAEPSEVVPPSARAQNDDDRACVERLRTVLSELGAQVPALTYDLNLEAALLAVLHQSGVTREEMLATLLVVARLPCVMAEGLAQRPHGLENYAMDLPPFRYQGAR
jgi:hypothetical protein